MNIRWGWSLGLFLSVALVAACGDDDDDVNGDAGVDGGVADDGGVIVSNRPTNGSAVALTADNSTMLVLNRRTGNAGLADAVLLEKYAVDLAASTLTLQGSEAVAGGTQILIGPDDDTAYVVGAEGAAKFTGIRSASLTRSGTAVGAGAEPRGAALSATGRHLYVASWSNGVVYVIRTDTMTVKSTVDLNIPLATSGLLGTVSARPALAHPWAVAITNDGDTEESDETVYVTEFFSQARTTTVTDDSFFDVGRQGVVYQFDTATETVGSLITIAPRNDTGFSDSRPGTTGCFPNQLNAATVNDGRLYVTAVCSSPRGPTGPVVTGGSVNPANFKTQIHAAIFVVNTETNTEVVGQGLLLTREFQRVFDGKNAADDGMARRIPLIINDIAFVPDSNVAYVTAYGSDAVFRVRYDDDGALAEVGSSVADFINLAPMGRLPYGIAITNTQQAVVVNEFSRNVSFIQLANQAANAHVNLTGASPTGAEAEINDGRRFFVTGLGRWSLRGQAWNSCEACHPQGLTDNVSWFFARGPRQTTSLDGSYSTANPSQRRIFNWTGIFDETHDFELNTRGNSGGIGAIVHANPMPPTVADRINFDNTNPNPTGNLQTPTPQAGLNGSTISLMPEGMANPKSVLDDWDRIAAYIRSIRAPKAPTNLAAADVTAGRTLFQDNNCAGCHGTDMWTISRVFYTPNETNNAANGLLRTTTYTADASFPAARNPPTSTSSRAATLRFRGVDAADNAANDQINCVLRDVGTFPASLDGMQNGITPTGVRVKEARANMTTPAQGRTGFNPPSLLGMVTGAPYFHAGNARTLEESLTDTFATHHKAFSANFLDTGDRATLVRQLVSFILSIDESTTAVDVPTTLGFDATLCPDSF